MSLVGTYAGLRWVFGWYYEPDEGRIWDAGVGAEETVGMVRRRFEVIPERMRYVVLPPEGYVMRIIGLVWSKG